MSPQHGPASPRTLVLRNARIHTFHDAHPLAHSIALSHGQVAAYDDDATALANADAQVLDLQGATIIPGINDSHAHMEREGLKTLRPSLAGARTVEDVLQVVRRQARLTPPGDYIVTMPVGTPPYFFGGAAQLAEGRLPTRQELDAAAPRHPVYIPAPFGNWGKPPGSGALNSLALARNGLSPASRPRCPGIELGRDAAGELNGIIVERNARPAVEFDLLPDVPRFGFADRLKGLRISQQLYHAKGTTSIYEGHGCAPETISVYRKLWEDGELTMRSTLVVSPTWGDLAEAARAMRDWLAVARGRGLGDPWFRVSGIHIAYGGDPAVACCARANLPDTGWSGFVEQAVTPTDFRALCLLAAEHDLRVNVIVSDKLHEVVPVLREVNGRFPLAKRRWVVQHIARSRIEDLKALKELDVLVTTIPTYFLWKGGAAYLDEPDGGERVVPHADMLAMGLDLALATDNIPYDPFHTLWVAGARQERLTGRVIGARQALSARAALHAFTVAGAKLSFDEDWKGPLAPGFAADLAVLDGDPMQLPPEAWRGLQCTMTIVGGRIVHGDPGAQSS
ncbi:amidohydrolase [Achromobacter insolitus]|uniref:Imidazolonepropionase n=1 Tax=Achromobacter insolitus TaxID=217204 RepID=A0A6S7EXY2_9BURK|nr:amidohydrolase [Achromobacter insolitus]CAB3930252.1 Imidazolonepropionase [Achromobacter insolitus]CAB3933236.1 Imidazolonepropionase [Achromobacter insolitus]